jgi:mannose-1-phosphate guanylyltransferase
MKTSDCKPHRCGVVLAGGDGKRLRPFVHKLLGFELPKQYVSFTGNRSMLEHTFDRAEQLIPPECLYTVVARDHLRHPEVRRQLSGRIPHTVVVQPMNRETGPGLLLPLAHLLLRHPNSTVAVFPSDHFILQEDLFAAFVQQAFEEVERYSSKIVFLGVEPTEAEPEYGYILPENQYLDSESHVKRVKTFIEKPDPRRAAQVISLGALWNTMTMVFKPEYFMHLVYLSAPTLHRSFQTIFRVLKTSGESSAVEEIYREMQPVNLSKDLLENFDMHSRDQLFAISMKDLLWSDWGSEQRILSVVNTLKYMDSLPNGFPLDEFRNQYAGVLSGGFEAIP